MNNDLLIKELAKNHRIFKELFTVSEKGDYYWKIEPNKWCLLEILCHLYDEELDDFRARTSHILEDPDTTIPEVDPEGWVTTRHYIEQNYAEMLQLFLNERLESVRWLKTLKEANWENTYNHPKFGAMTANQFLANWLAHDYLHIRQILKLKYDFLASNVTESLSYAGKW